MHWLVHFWASQTNFHISAQQGMSQCLAPRVFVDCKHLYLCVHVHVAVNLDSTCILQQVNNQWCALNGTNLLSKTTAAGVGQQRPTQLLIRVALIRIAFTPALGIQTM